MKDLKDLKDFSVENLETTPSTFLLKFSSDIYSSRIINYWGRIFTLYLTWGAFSLICVLSIFFFLLLFLFLSSFSLTDIKDSNDNRERRGNHYFSFHFHSLTNIHLVFQDFHHFFLIDLFVIARLIADETFYLDFH